MSSVLSYPGVYVEEVPSGVRTLIGVATSITAFVGAATAGQTEEPVMLTSFADYERQFGGLALASPMSYAVRDFYLNGGALALVVRVVGTAADPDAVDAPSPASAATITLPIEAGGNLVLTAASVGAWGGRLSAAVDFGTDSGLASADTTRFNLRLRYRTRAGRDEFQFETLGSVSTTPGDPRYLPLVLERESTLVRALGAVAAGRPASTVTATTITWVDAAGGNDGPPLRADDLLGNADARTGIHALAHADLFNLLVIPPLARNVATLPSTYTPVPTNVWQDALALCVERRAMLIVDPDPGWALPAANAIGNAQTGRTGLNLSGPAARNAALYFPCLRMIDPLRDSRVDTFMPSGMIAGVIARTDVARGVWKAPAGLDASLNGVQDLQLGQLNPLGINCLRSMGVNGRVVWGARTLRGADASADEYKYLPVRRLALFLEESLYRGTQWAVFEPNDEPLWAQVRLNIGAFMQGLFRQGAFQGASARDAYFVKCDSQTTTQADINLGVLNVVVGFAPLKPAEFVVIKVQQMAGQIPT